MSKILNKLSLIGRTDIIKCFNILDTIKLDVDDVISSIDKNIWNSIISMDNYNNDFAECDIQNILTHFILKYIYENEDDKMIAYIRSMKVIENNNEAKYKFPEHVLLFNYKLTEKDINAFDIRSIIHRNLYNGWLGIKIDKLKTNNLERITVSKDGETLFEEEVRNSSLEIQFTSIFLKECDGDMRIKLDFMFRYNGKLTDVYKSIDITDKLSNKMRKYIEYIFSGSITNFKTKMIGVR